jgi:Carboxypeptidase regulatory-like domain/TonB dependent receptor-like, beta-barrel
MNARVARPLAWLAVLALTSAAAQAQPAGSAELVGRIVDPQGAAIAGAHVTAVDTSTGVGRQATSNTDGRFDLSSLPPSTYDVRASAKGFADAVLSSVALPVGRAVSLRVSLEVAGHAERVLVEGTPLVDTADSAVDGIIGASTIENLPLNGRNFLELSFLVPGNAPTPNFDPTKTNTVLVSSAGQLGRGGNVTIDGVDVSDDVVGGSIQNLPEDAVQEFQIATNRFSAELGRSGSSVINVVTKSGTESTHGAASVFLRDHNWQALPATFDRSTGQEPPFRRQQYALSLGGPVVSQKLFWFASAEDRNQDGGILVGTRDLATRTFRRSFADAPLDDFLGLARLDWTPSGSDRFSARYSYEDAKDTSSSASDRALGSASQRQAATNATHVVTGAWNRTFASAAVNDLRVSWSRFRNDTVPVSSGPQLTFPSFLDGSSFRVPQGTTQRRFQAADSLSFLKGNHSLKFGAEIQKIGADFDLGVFREGRIEFVQDFPQFDLNGDGVVDDDDLLFAVTLRSATPERDLALHGIHNTHLAFFAQDDWRVSPRFTLNLGVRYELDTNEKNNGGYANVNPLVQSFYEGDRKKDSNNIGPRIGFNWASSDGRTSLHGGYGIYYDRITLEITSLEQGLDGRALAIEVRAGNAIFFDPSRGGLPPGAPTLEDPFTGFILPGAGASGINIIDNRMENPTVQQFNLGFQRQIGSSAVVRVDGLHDLGTHFIIGRSIGTVENPVVGGPDVVKNLESSVNTHYDGLLVSAEKRFAGGSQLRASYTLSKAFNYANDDQIPFSYGPVDPNNLRLDYGPTPNDQRHRFVLSGTLQLPRGFSLSPIWTLASAVPMDIMMPDGSTRVPVFQRNAGGRQFRTGADLNAFIVDLNASGGVNGTLLPLVRDDVRFGDSFDSLDLRLSKTFVLGSRAKLEAIVECFNVFNVTNILGRSTTNYSGFSNVLVRDSDDPSDPGYLRSSSFGEAVTTAGGVFGSGGPRAFQLGMRLRF